MVIELCQALRVLRQVFEEMTISSMRKLKGAVNGVRRVRVLIMGKVLVETMKGWTNDIEAYS